MPSQMESGDGPRIANTAVDCTAEYLIQIGILQGDLHLTLRVESPPLDDHSALAAAERILARSLLYRWRAEADAWDLTDPKPLPVRWTPSRRVASAGDHVPAGSGTDTIAGVFLGLRPQRLVVLGTAGSGKTVLAVLLALELLARRLTQGEDDVPIPLVLSLESWDVQRQPFIDWLADRLRRDHPGLPPVDGVHPARRLLLERRVLPVLDGLDELPERRRAEVLDALNAGLGGERDAVLVSRTNEYARLDQDGRGLRRATVIESLPLRPDEVADYLRRARPPARTAAWARLLETLEREPSAPVSWALSNPLMVWLVRRSYEHHSTDPNELADRQAYPDRQAVEAHLLDRIVPVAFPSRPPDPDRLHPPRVWDSQRADAWLSYLALLLSRREESELAWWRLYKAPLPRLLALPALLTTGILLSLVIKLVTSSHAESSMLGGPIVTTEVSVGVLFAAVARSVAASWFGQRLTEPRRSTDPLLFVHATRSLDPHSRVDPQARLAVLTGGPALVVLLLALYVFVVPHPALVWFAIGGVLPALLMIVYAAPADTVDAATPDELLHGERNALLTTVTLVAPLIGAGGGAFFWLRGQPGWWPAVAGWAGASALLVLLSPWSRWVLAKCSLATVGRVPWSLMTFLKDARAAGLLQVSGGTYRFRNRRLQEHLAGRCEAERGGRTRRGGLSGLKASRLPLLADPRDFTVEHTEDGYLLRGRSRRLPLAHWAVLGPLMGLFVVRFSVSGQWEEPAAWLALLFWPFVGAMITVLGYLMPPRRVELELTRHGVASVIGRRRRFYEWRHVEEITVRRAIVRGRDARFYALQVRLLAGAPRPPRRSRMGGGWYFVLSLGLTPHLDPRLGAALADFAGPRWASSDAR
ncbi:NACHT domain-containing protein [Actinocorallia sp. B10E7]|uniref:NACHT domain-containing protein n=1 Tax=Actinocorallia sp. B10E7 TaxID=3153558 RepID=UPI00325DF587